MSFLNSVVLPQAAPTGGFLKSVMQPVQGYTQPSAAPQPTTAPDENKAPFYSTKGAGPVSTIKSIWDSIKSQWNQGQEQINQPFIDKATSGHAETPLEAANGALDVGVGTVTKLTAPFAPILNPIGQAIQKSGEGYATIPAVQQFAQTPAGEKTMQGADIVQKVATVAGGVLGGVEALRGKVEPLEAPGGGTGTGTYPPATIRPETPVATPSPYSQPTFLKSVVHENPPKAEPIAPPEPTPRTVGPNFGLTPSKVGASIETKAIEKGLTDSFHGTAGYDPITIKEQAAKVADLIANDPFSARAMAKGEMPIPNDIRSSALLVGLEDHATRTGDAALLRDLAQSPLTSETSVHAQELRLLGERTPDSAVQLIRDIQKTREANAVKQSGDIKKAKSTEVNKIKSEIAKVNTKQTWSEFVQSIQC